MDSFVTPFFPAVLALADGRFFLGHSVGVAGTCVGEVVFNTAMTGYQEILSDPSYHQQIVTLTSPHIGNVGVNLEDVESAQPCLSGLVIRDLSPVVSSWRATAPLSEYLQKHRIVAIADIDTRALTCHIREQGAQSGCLMAASDFNSPLDVGAAIECARAFSGLGGKDLVKHVTASRSYNWTAGSWSARSLPFESAQSRLPLRIVVLDFGVKHNILRMLIDRQCEVLVMPAHSTLQEVLAFSPSGVLLSNGPGDPEPCDYAIGLIKLLLQYKIPLFGICLGHQLLAHALGARIIKMKCGHHGANHPVQDLHTGRVFITSQNHGFAVDASSLPDHLLLTHLSLFDGSVQGIKHRDYPVFSFQGHPEASPGPQDIAYLFDQFVQMCQAYSFSLAVN